MLASVPGTQNWLFSHAGPLILIARACFVACMHHVFLLLTLIGGGGGAAAAG